MNNVHLTKQEFIAVHNELFQAILFNDDEHFITAVSKIQTAFDAIIKEEQAVDVGYIPITPTSSMKLNIDVADRDLIDDEHLQQLADEARAEWLADEEVEQ